jgi:cholest-4-en-3-one 26-monooxygenase
VVKKLEGKFREYAANIVDTALEKGTFNFVTDMAHAMPMEALDDVLRVPRESMHKCACLGRLLLSFERCTDF